jgi:hypothetical protein
MQAIVLVGGFGKCEYVYNILKAIYEEQGIEILRPRGEFSDALVAEIFHHCRQYLTSL